MLEGSNRIGKSWEGLSVGVPCELELDASLKDAEEKQVRPACC